MMNGLSWSGSLDLFDEIYQVFGDKAAWKKLHETFMMRFIGDIYMRLLHFGLCGFLIIFLFIAGCSNSEQTKITNPTEIKSVTDTQTMKTPIQTPRTITPTLTTIVGKYHSIDDPSKTAEFREDGTLILTNLKDYTKGTWEKGVLSFDEDNIAGSLKVIPGNGYVIKVEYIDDRWGPGTKFQSVGISDATLSFLAINWEKI